MTDAAGSAGGTAGQPLPSRLAVIVSIDAAGYSRQSEIDQATAIREITALGERIRASAASREGRVFNTAGDGFMLEFPSAAAAVAAAEELQAVERVPLRIGVHVGEAVDTPNGDLLGRGVNIAARLMQLAAPGGIVVSTDVKQRLAEDTAARLRRRGVVRLNKMAERLEIFELGSPWRRPRPKPWMFGAAGAGAVALALLVWFGAQALLQPASRTIAVMEFRAIDPSLQPFTVGLAERLIGTMSSNDLQPAHSSAAADADRVAAARATGAAFVLDGVAHPEGGDLLVSARLVDVRDNVTLWSSEYRRVASEQGYMQEQIAADVSRVLRCARVGSRGNARGVSQQALILFLRACDRMDNVFDNPEETHLIARQVTQAAPRFSRGWSLRAMTAAQLYALTDSDEEREAYRAEALEAAARSRQLDRSNGESYLAEANLLDLYAWREWQALIERALEAEPDLAAAHAAQANFYLALGRARDAMRPMQRATALDPLNPEIWSELVPVLASNGDQQEADALRERLYRIWPNSESAWRTRLANATYVGDPAEALQMLDNMDSGPVQFDPMVTARWRAFLLARQSGNPARLRAAALALRDLIPGRYSRNSVAAALSSAGEVDAAYEVMQSASAIPGYWPSSMFMPPWANLRRDRRFLRLFRGVGLIDYWRETGRWPDFCADPRLPYNCEEEAARVSPP